MSIYEVKELIKSSRNKEVSLAEKIRLDKLILSTCPKAGQGVNLWLCHAQVIWLRHPFYYSEETRYALLTKAIIDSGRNPQPNEVERVLQNIRLDFSHPSKTTATLPAPPGLRFTFTRDEVLSKKVIQGCEEAQERLYDQSEVSEPWKLPFYNVLTMWFKLDALLCFCRHKCDYGTARIVMVSKLETLNYVPPFVVPNPAIGRRKLPTKTTKRKSVKSIYNFNKRHYLITEFDEGTLDQQAAKILWLVKLKLLTLVMVVWSGGRSLHAWWDVRKVGEMEAMKFFQIAYSIGACIGPKTINQIVRTPNATNPKTNKQQLVIYLKQ